MVSFKEISGTSVLVFRNIFHRFRDFLKISEPMGRPPCEKLFGT